MTILAIVGVFGNVVSVVILNRTKLDLGPLLQRLLVTLAVFDTIFLVTGFLTYSLPLLSYGYRDTLEPVSSYRSRSITGLSDQRFTGGKNVCKRLRGFQAKRLPRIING